MMAHLLLSLLGPFQVTLDGEPVTSFESDKVRALLAYLAVEADRPHHREVLAGLLWPDWPDRAARTNLRNALANLRKAIGDRQATPPFLLITRETIQFNTASDYWLDVTAFTEMVEADKTHPSAIDQLEQAVALYRGSFLEGFSVGDSPAFEEWALFTRERLARQMSAVLHRLAATYEGRGEYEQAQSCAWRQVELEPWDEAAHRQLMRTLALGGQRSAALAQYETCRRLLAEELGVEPAKETTRLYEQIRDGELEMPVLPRVAARKHNLPAQVTSFIGREREIGEVMQLLATTRLLTLTGPPGTGKTRLGLQVAAQVLDRFADGVFFVDLAPISDPQHVPSTVAQVLGVRETAAQSLVESLKNHLCRRHLLLLLDNFEQIIEAAPLVGELLSASPGLKALVTSREALHVYGEQEYLVPPLALPDLDHIDPLRVLLQYEAVELFSQRAQAVRSGFTITDEDAPAIAEICVRLDGLPLAIELAAARSKLLSPEMMRRRLESRLGTLTGGARDLPARLRTLRGAIDWSYDLLDADEKTLFARLSVFQGGRSVEAVEAVCGHGLAIAVTEGLESLLHKSLLQLGEGLDGEPRFLFLETIHEYARERLEESGEAETVQKRHADYFVALAEQAETNLFGAGPGYGSARLRIEHDNLRTALAWSLGGADAELGLRLVGALRDFWFYSGHFAEGWRWAERACESAEDAPPALRAKALNAAGLLADARGDKERSNLLLREALALSREAGDRINHAWALAFLAMDLMDYPDRYDEGIALCEEGLALFREVDHKPGIARTLNILGELARLVGDYERAQEVYEECLAIAREIGDRHREALILGCLGTVAQHQGDYERAEALTLEALAPLRELHLRYGIAPALLVLVGPVGAKGQAERAARLLGA
ncbi:MAG: tetratricopeptide repeat protein, partial [Anaerolineae bacterium]|nr:tetratricopeptide repeat protein [Anaerolineae bacterium]